MADIAELGLVVDSKGVVRATKDLRKMEGQSKETERATRSLGATAKKATKNIALMAAAAAALAAAYAVVKTKEFEKSVSDLSAITGATGKNLEFMSKKAKEFGATTTLSASQAVEAFKLIASAKPDLLDNAEALAQVTKETITLAEAAGIELPAAANALGNALNQFGAGADEASKFINVLAAGSKFGASSIEDINAALVNVGGTAATVGLSFEETNAALQVMAASGIKASEAGTGLRSVLLNLEKQNNDKFKPSVVGVSQAFINLKDAGLTTTQQMDLFGKLMFNQGNTLIKNADKLESLTGKLTDTSTAYEQAATRTDNLDGDTKALGSAIEALAINIGDEFLPALREMAQLATAAAKAINSLFDEVSAEEMALTSLTLEIQAAEISLEAMEGQTNRNERAITAKRKALERLNKELETMVEVQTKATESEEKAAEAKETIAASESSGEGSGTKEEEAQEAALIALHQSQADQIEASQDFLATQQMMAEESLLSQEELAIEYMERKLGRIEQEKQAFIDAKWSEAEAEEEVADARAAVIAASEANIDASRGREAKGFAAFYKLKTALRQGDEKATLSSAISITAALGKHNRTAFEVSKALATGEAIMNTAQAATRALAEGGPYLGPALAAVAVAMGAAQISTIQSQSFGGGGGSPPTPSGGGAVSGGSAGGPTSQGIPTAPEEEIRTPVQITVINQGNGTEFIDTMVIPQITERVDNADVQIINPDSRNARELAA